MKAEEIRELTDEQLGEKITELKESLFRLRFKLSLGNTDVVKELRRQRKDLARVKTIITQRQKETRSA
jgi:large subunit ribosomal protein L29